MYPSAQPTARRFFAFGTGIISTLASSSEVFMSAPSKAAGRFPCQGFPLFACRFRLRGNHALRVPVGSSLKVRCRVLTESFISHALGSIEAVRGVGFGQRGYLAHVVV